MERARTILIAALAMLLAACSSPPRRPLILPLAAHDPVSDTFPLAAQFLSGFDIEPGATPESGDAILFGISVHAPAEQIWYFRLTLLPPDEASPRWNRSVEWGDEREVFEFESDTLPVYIELFDDGGELLQSGRDSIPIILLDRGLFDAATSDGAADQSSDAARARALGVLGIATFTESLGSQRVLKSVLWKVIDHPPWWTLIGGVDLSIEYAQGVVTDAPHPALLPGTRSALVPVDLTVNGHVALRLNVLVGPAAPPLGLCGGALSIEGAGTQDDRPRLSVRLLAARRGVPPP